MDNLNLKVKVKYRLDKYDENNCLIESVEHEDEMTPQEVEELQKLMEV